MERQYPLGLGNAGNPMPASVEHSMARKSTGPGGHKGKSNRIGLAFDPIAAALKQMHDEVASESIPDDFLRLLDEIDERAASRKQN